MRSILVLLEDLVQAEFGARDLAEVRAAAALRQQDPGRLPGPGGRVMAFVEAIAQVRRRPLCEAYQFVGLKLVPVVLREYPGLVRGHDGLTAILMQVSRVVPSALSVLLPGVDAPHFDLELMDAGSQRVSFEGFTEAACLVEGVLLGLGLHFGERVTVQRAMPPAFAPDRRLIDVKVQAGERRTAPSLGPPDGKERRRFFGL